MTFEEMEKTSDDATLVVGRTGRLLVLQNTQCLPQLQRS